MRHRRTKIEAIKAEHHWLIRVASEKRAAATPPQKEPERRRHHHHQAAADEGEQATQATQTEAVAQPPLVIVGGPLRQLTVEVGELREMVADMSTQLANIEAQQAAILARMDSYFL